MEWKPGYRSRASSWIHFWLQAGCLNCEALNAVTTAWCNDVFVAWSVPRDEEVGSKARERGGCKEQRLRCQVKHIKYSARRPEKGPQLQMGKRPLVLDPTALPHGAVCFTPPFLTPEFLMLSLARFVFSFFSLSHCSSLMLICMLARHVSLLLSNIRLFSCQEETKCSVGSWIGEMEIRQQIVKRGCATVFSQQPHLTYSCNSQLVTYAWLSFIKLQCFLSKCPNNTPTPFPNANCKNHLFRSEHQRYMWTAINTRVGFLLSAAVFSV